MFDERRRRIDLSPCSGPAVARFQEELGNLLTDPNPETLSFYNGLLNSHTLADYVPDNAILVMDRPARLSGEAEEQEARYELQRGNRQSRGELPYGFPSPAAAWDSVHGQLTQSGVATVDILRWGSDEDSRLVQTLPDTLTGLSAFTDDVAARIAADGAVVAVSQHAGRLHELLDEAEVYADIVEDLPARPRAGRVYLLHGALRKGWQVDAAATRPPWRCMATANSSAPSSSAATARPVPAAIWAMPSRLPTLPPAATSCTLTTALPDSSHYPPGGHRRRPRISGSGVRGR